MKRLIALLLLSPALASATPCMQGCDLGFTAGSMTIDLSGDNPGGVANFNVSGPGFTASGGWDVFGPSLGNALDIHSGETLNFSWGENVDGGFFMSVSVDGFGVSTAPPMTNGPSGFGAAARHPAIRLGRAVREVRRLSPHAVPRWRCAVIPRLRTLHVRRKTRQRRQLLP
jgi:hypothetical protein